MPLPIKVTALEYFLLTDLKALLFMTYSLTLYVPREAEDGNDHLLYTW